MFRKLLTLTRHVTKDVKSFLLKNSAEVSQDQYFLNAHRNKIAYQRHAGRPPVNGIYRHAGDVDLDPMTLIYET